MNLTLTLLVSLAVWLVGGICFVSYKRAKERR